MVANEKMVEMARRSEAREAFLDAEARFSGVYEEGPVREALRMLATKLRAVDEATGGELAAEAREVWLDSILPLHDPKDLIRALSHVSDVCMFVENWTDCARPEARSGAMAEADRREREIRAAIEVVDREVGDPPVRAPVRMALVIQLDGAKERGAEAHDEFFAGTIEPARDASTVALSALVGLVDAMRARAPESLQ